MKIVKGMFLILLFVLLLVLAVQNIESLFTRVMFQADLHFFHGAYSTPIWAIILLFFFLGVIAMGVFSLVERIKLKREGSALKRSIKEKDKELNSLRNLPITSTDLPGFNENGK